MTIRGKVKEAALAAEDKHVQVPPIPKPCSPHLAIKESFLLWTKAKTPSSHTFPPSSFFYLIISVSRCCLCLEGNLHVVLVGLSSVSKRSSCIQSFLHYHMTLFLLDFLWWNPPCLLLLYMKRTFLKNHFLFLICKSMWKKNTKKIEKEKMKACCIYP